MSKKTKTIEIETSQVSNIGDSTRSVFNNIKNRIDRFDRELEKLEPFSQAELNLSERKSKILKALKTLEQEGLL